MAGLERDREQGLPDKATSVFCFLETFFFFSPIHKHVKILFLSCGYFSCFQFLFSVFFFFNFKFLFLLYFTLQYCIGFGIHWHESATGVHELGDILKACPGRCERSCNNYYHRYSFATWDCELTSSLEECLGWLYTQRHIAMSMSHNYITCKSFSNLWILKYLNQNLWLQVYGTIVGHN